MLASVGVGRRLASVVSTRGFTVVNGTAGTMAPWLVALGEVLRGASVSTARGASLAVVSSGGAFPAVPPCEVAALGEVFSVTTVGAGVDAMRPPSSSMGVVGSGEDVVGVKVVVFGGWRVPPCLLVSLGELPATAAVEGTRLTAVVATGVLIRLLSSDCEMDDGDENRGSNDGNEYDDESSEEVDKEDDKACRGAEDAITEDESISDGSDVAKR